VTGNKIAFAYTAENVNGFSTADAALGFSLNGAFNYGLDQVVTWTGANSGGPATISKALIRAANNTIAVASRSVVGTVADVNLLKLDASDFINLGDANAKGFTLSTTNSTTAGATGFAYTGTFNGAAALNTVYSTMQLSASLTGSSAANPTLLRGLSFNLTNGMIGGGQIGFLRGLDLGISVNASTATQNAEGIVVEVATNLGTVSTAYGFHIYGLPGSSTTSKIGIQDESGGIWRITGMTFATLTAAPYGTANNGSVTYCTDCKNVSGDSVTAGSVVVSGSTTGGTFVWRVNGQWRVFF
jgi:hypothetical protein